MLILATLATVANDQLLQSLWARVFAQRTNNAIERCMMDARVQDIWVGIDHVQLAIPPGSEDVCRSFYVGLLSMTEIPKPLELAGRGGLWLRSGILELHLGVEQDFRPARKAHPALIVSDIDFIADRLLRADKSVQWDEAYPGRRRFFTADNLGNRIEIVQATSQEPAAMASS